MKENKTKIILSVLFLAGLVGLAMFAGAGNLEPNAPPGPTMHTLEDIYDLVSSQGELPQASAFDCFLKIDGIPGEATDDKHKDWIELLSYSHGISQPPAAERPDLQDLSLVKTLDKASPKLFLYSCTGALIPYIQVEFCRATGDKRKYMGYKMEDVIVTFVKTVAPANVQAYSDIEFKNFTLAGLAGGESLPMEEVSFNYRRIMWEYITADGNSIQTGWDLDTNSPIIPSPD